MARPLYIDVVRMAIRRAKLDGFKPRGLEMSDELWCEIATEAEGAAPYVFSNPEGGNSLMGYPISIVHGVDRAHLKVTT